jgi:hypothetical protein
MYNPEITNDLRPSYVFDAAGSSMLMCKVSRRQSLRLQVPPRGKMLIHGFARFRLGMVPAIRAFVGVLYYDLSWWLLPPRAHVHWQVVPKVPVSSNILYFLVTSAPEQHGMETTSNPSQYRERA